MKGINSRIDGRKLILEVDLDQDFGPSSTGKSNFVATTGGFIKIESEPGVSYGLNVVRSNKVARKAPATVAPANDGIETLTV